MVQFSLVCIGLLAVAVVDGMRQVRISTNASAVANATAEWSPCPRGMCWDSWGAHRNTKYAGVGGIGDRGCKKWFSCPGSSKVMDCGLGPCPRYFGSPACVSTSRCKSYCDLKHAGSCKYSGPKDDVNSSWMREFTRVPLKELLVVSAHHVLAQLGTLDFDTPVDIDALKYIAAVDLLGRSGKALGDVVSSHLAPMMSSCQSDNVKTLLRAGVRAFDFRPHLSQKDNKLHDSHGARGPEIEGSLSDIATYVQQNPSEIVFVYFQNLLGSDSDGDCKGCGSMREVVARVRQAVAKYFGTCGAGKLICNVDTSKNVGDLIKTGNIIVHTNNDALAYSHEEIHNDDSIYYSPWHNTNSLSTLKSKVLAKSGSTRRRKLNGVQWILTPGTNDYVGALSQRYTANWQSKANPHGCQSLACFASVASAQSFKESVGIIRLFKYHPNFLMLDYANMKGTMDVVLWYNRKYN